jgi:DNA-binding protein
MEAAIEQYAPSETRNDTPNVSLPLPYNLHPSCIHMQVQSGSKAKNLVQFVIRKFSSSDPNSPTIEQVTWNAFGDGISKAIACAEITKRRLGINFYEYVQIGYKRIEDTWKPVNSNVELDTLKVNKDIPAICILLSKLPLLKSNEGEN